MVKYIFLALEICFVRTSRVLTHQELELYIYIFDLALDL